ncbi:MAG: ABC transporter substrate-binding protein [Dehalococcoidia bacterium]|nr:ABC transporter substrate-binding protein [Dehalococcoidia bacterium]
MFKCKVILLFTALILVLSTVVACATTSTPGKDAGPIVFGYVGAASSPGTKPVMTSMQVATDEINAAGGILGRPVKFVIEDSKGETSLAVAAAQRMVMGNKALIYFGEGRTEICLAIKPKSAELFPQYPHILVFQGAMGRELTEDVVKDYEKYRFVFRDWDPEDAYYCVSPAYFGVFKEVIGASKIAFLWEDLAWTTVWRNGLPGLPKWEDYAKEVYGLETVYSKPVKARTGMYLPVLESLATSGAQAVWFVSSWYTDTEVFAKQWATSSAKDIPVCFFGGVSQTYDFWNLTGGKCLGALGTFYEKQVPVTPVNIEFLQKMDKLGIPVQNNVAVGYSDMYLYKKGIEKAGTTDVETLIKTMEGLTLSDTTWYGMFGTSAVRTAPFFHSRILANPDNPREPAQVYKENPQYWYSPIGQFQGKDNVVLMATGTNSKDWPIRYKGDFAEPEKYKSPAQLRLEAGK